MNNENAKAIVQNLLNKVGALEYQNTLLQVENESLKKQAFKEDKKNADK
ncbi:hypothetical protein HC014_08045 [Limosilactobacillus fermentum]